jgi:hypothetical protein
MAGSSPSPEDSPVTRTLALLTLCLLASPAPAADPLTPKQIADGWVKLFDGESTFGWPKEARVENGKLVLAAPADKALTVALVATQQCELMANYSYARLDPAASGAVSMVLEGGSGRSTTPLINADADKPTTSTWRCGFAPAPASATLVVPRGVRLVVNQFLFRPLDAKSIFDGKTLAGWKPYAGDAKRERSKFDVTAEGELRVVDGPGDLQTTATYADFLLQFDCKTRGKNLNSGVFFRCLPGEYQAGYEAQIQNAFKDDDRTKPTDFGTGAIYRRVPARKVVSSDDEWFTMTVLAVGPTIRTWVNGEPVVSWTDDRPRDDNARKGLRTAAGHLSIQGHDPTTDILFRNLRVLDLK